MSLKELNGLSKLIYEIISFGSARGIVIAISLSFLFFLVTPTNFFIFMPGLCIFKKFILPFVFRGNCPTVGVFAFCECPACGMTRAMSSFMHGNFELAWDYNPLVYILIPILLVVLIINIKGMKK